MRVGISGHQQIPAPAQAWLDQEVRALMARWAAFVAVSSLAKGADQLFARHALAAGQRLEVIIPCHRYEQTFAQADRVEYERLLARASAGRTLEFSEPSEEAFLAAGHAIADNVDRLVAIWDGRPAKGRGGTADIVDYARQRNLDVTVLWPPGAGPHDDQHSGE